VEVVLLNDQRCIDLSRAFVNEHSQEWLEIDKQAITGRTLALLHVGT